MFETVLVANRGEIACRVIRTLRELGIRSVAVYTEQDAGARHVGLADVAVRVPGYLDAAAIIQVALDRGAQAVHPGYGFLSENTHFAQACADAGIVFVGPPAEAIEAMGDKIRAKAHVAAHGVPVIPGAGEAGMTDADLLAAAATVGYPMLIKPSAGGGGKGMTVVESLAQLPEALAASRRVAKGAFGDDTLLLERFIASPRHIEVQVLADAHGHVIHLGERECSLQRRHQKIIEEAPSPLLDAATRAAIGAAACEAARSVGYVGAGTVEFLVSDAAPDEFYFMEMNTRLQVEHPVTELVTGLDLVAWQLRIAAGEPLTIAQEDVTLTGHAIEARVYAEDPARGFLPATGRVLALWLPRALRIEPTPRIEPVEIPVPERVEGAGRVASRGRFDELSDRDEIPVPERVEGPGRVASRGRFDELSDRAPRIEPVEISPASSPAGGLDKLHPPVPRIDPRPIRVDHALVPGLEVTADYDPMLAKVIAHGDTRAQAIARLDAALADTLVLGVTTNIAFLRELLARDDVREGHLDTGLIDRMPPTEPRDESAALAAAALVTHAAAWGDAPWRRPSGWRVGEHRAAAYDFGEIVTVLGSPHEAVVTIGGERHDARLLSAAPKAGIEFDGRVIRFACAHEGDTIWLGRDGETWQLRRRTREERLAEHRAGLGRPAGAADPEVRSAMPGKVVHVAVADGDAVDAGQPIVTIEAMKMEHAMVATVAGTVALEVRVGDQVRLDQVVARIHVGQSEGAAS